MQDISTTQPCLSLQHHIFDTKMLADSENKASILRIPVNDLKPGEFRVFLARQLPLVITGLNGSLQLPWSPTYLIAEHGMQPCTMEDCEAQLQPMHVLLEEFLSLFSPGAANESPFPEAIWKVKVCIWNASRKSAELMHH
jgi:hypothetical protein